jgi:beta-glucosidase
MAACAKHFAGYGFAEGGRDYNTADFSDYTLWNFVLPPFQATAEAGVATFMNAFNPVNGIPATAQPVLVPEILNKKWNYPGVVVSDWGSIGEMVAHGHAQDLKHAAELAARAGCSMDMESSAYTQYLAELVRSGKVSESTVDDAVRRILTLKIEMGLLDAHYLRSFKGSGRAARGTSGKSKPEIQPVVEFPMALALEAAEKSFVLLENRNALLPLSPMTRVALVGPLAQEKNGPLGNWRAQAVPNSAVSVEEGMRALWSNRVTVARGPVGWTGTEAFHAELAVNTADTVGWAAALRAAAQAEVAVVAVGEHGLLSGEGGAAPTPICRGFKKRFCAPFCACSPAPWPWSLRVAR